MTDPGPSATAPWRETVVARWRIGQERSIVGPGDPEEHLRRAEVMAAVLDPPSHAVDLGSGAGIPGLALAGLWPDSNWVLLDAARRRTLLLQESVDALGWSGRITVVHGRAEEIAHDPVLRGYADLVTSRSFGPPAVVAECGAPFLQLGGILAVTEPPGSEGGRWPSAALRQVGLSNLGVRGGVQLLRLEEPVPDSLPRRPGIPAKRPLF